MAPSDRSSSHTRERWLPLIQSLVQMRRWSFDGAALEQFVDAVIPYLAQPEVTNVQIGISVIEHYYYDAPLVHLLRTDSEQAVAMWNVVVVQIKPSAHGSNWVPDSLAELRRQVMAMFRAALDTHTYQLRLTALLAMIVQTVEEEFAHGGAWQEERS